MVVITVIIVIAAVGIILLIGEKEKPVGEYAEYGITGSYGATTFDGTMRVTIVSEKSNQYKVETKYELYQTVGGVRTLLADENETEWQDKNDYADIGIKTESTTITAKWGAKTVDVYTDTKDGRTTTTYIGVDDGVPYRLVSLEAGLTLTFDLKDTNATTF